VRPGDAEKFGRELGALQDEATRLEQRIKRLESASKR
jgi:ubiquinone biosynthesis protein UbiJ